MQTVASRASWKLSTVGVSISITYDCKYCGPVSQSVWNKSPYICKPSWHVICASSPLMWQVASLLLKKKFKEEQNAGIGVEACGITEGATIAADIPQE